MSRMAKLLIVAGVNSCKSRKSKKSCLWFKSQRKFWVKLPIVLFSLTFFFLSTDYGGLVGRYKQ